VILHKDKLIFSAICKIYTALKDVSNRNCNLESICVPCSSNVIRYDESVLEKTACVPHRSDKTFILPYVKIDRHSFLKKILKVNPLRPIGFEVLIAVAIKTSILWDITPCSPVKFNRRFREIYRRHLQSLLASRFMLVSCLACSSTLRMETICSSEMTQDDLHRTT
jgi:hypothetical protein